MSSTSGRENRRYFVAGIAEVSECRLRNPATPARTPRAAAHKELERGEASKGLERESDPEEEFYMMAALLFPPN